MLAGTKWKGNEMTSVNKVIVVGNIGRDPETRHMPSGDAVTNISVATTDRYKDKQSGEMKENTEWHRIAFFGKLAEIAGQYLKKGSQIYVEGRLRTGKWTDASGQEKYSTEIVAEVMQMLGGKPTDAANVKQVTAAQANAILAAQTNTASAIAPVQQQVTPLATQVQSNNQTALKGISGATAIAMMPPVAPGKTFSVGIGMGNFQGGGGNSRCL